MTPPQEISIDVLDKRIEALMMDLHVPAHLKGFQYLKRAIYIVFNEPSALNNVVEGLYPRVAAEFGTDGKRLERNARTALEHVPISFCDAIFKRSRHRLNKNTTPKEFIALCVQKLKFDDASQSKEPQHKI